MFFFLFSVPIVEECHYYRARVKASGEKKNVQAVWMDKGQMMFQTSEGLTKLLAENDLEIIKEIKSKRFWKG